MYSRREILDILDRNYPLQQARTQIDFLDLEYNPGNGCRSVKWEQSLDDASVTPFLSDGTSVNPGLRIFFMTSKKDQDYGRNTGDLLVQRGTLEHFCTHLRISAPFLEGVLRPSPWAKAGNASFNHRDAEQKVLNIEGYYQYLNGWIAGRSNIWFSYNVKTGSSTYLLFDCPRQSKDRILRRAHEDAGAFMSCPFAVDMLIADECCSSWKSLVDRLREKLLHWENNGGEGIPLHSIIHTPHGTQTLHSLSHGFQTVIGDLHDLEERLDFLIETGKNYASLATSAPLPIADSAVERLIFFRSRTRIWKRWVENYNERTRLMMNLFFNIASQVDSRTNLEIANLTSRLAADARRDSSSMITIAAVTMVFLPGTFVSAIFSMVFFNAGTDNGGNVGLTVLPQWWYFPTVTIPLTVLVFAVWQWWWRKREADAGLVDSSASKNHDALLR